jgi:hypothetical protein
MEKLSRLKGDWQWHLQEVRQRRELEKRGLLRHEMGLRGASATAEADAFSYTCGGGRLEDDDNGDAVLSTRLMHIA